jgi:signal transduction histidine kinase
MQYPSEEIRLTIIGVTFLLLFFGLTIIFLIFIFSKKNQLYQKEKEILRSNFELTISQSRLETQEETMSLLSKELHDNIGQLLNSTKLLIGVTQRSLEISPETLNIAEETVGKAIQEIRSLSKSMNKQWLEQFSLLENLQAEIIRINAAGIMHIKLSHSGTLILEADKQIILFRIVQETLQNAIKHARANSIDINIVNTPGNLIITVTDNGVGMDAEAAKGMGILNIKHRAGLLGGEAVWNTEPKEGTTVSISIPIKELNYEH